MDSYRLVMEKAIRAAMQESDRRLTNTHESTGLPLEILQGMVLMRKDPANKMAEKIESEASPEDENCEPENPQISQDFSKDSSKMNQSYDSDDDEPFYAGQFCDVVLEENSNDDSSLKFENSCTEVPNTNVPLGLPISTVNTPLPLLLHLLQSIQNTKLSSKEDDVKSSSNSKDLEENNSKLPTEPLLNMLLLNQLTSNGDANNALFSLVQQNLSAGLLSQKSPSLINPFVQANMAMTSNLLFNMLLQQNSAGESNGAVKARVYHPQRRNGNNNEIEMDANKPPPTLVKKNGIFSCSGCSYTSKHRGNIKMHIRTVHYRERPHGCPYCKYGAPYKGKLLTHIKAVHHKEKKEFKCSFCPFEGYYEGHLKDHVKDVHGDECRASFGRKNEDDEEMFRTLNSIVEQSKSEIKVKTEDTYSEQIYNLFLNESRASENLSIVDNTRIIKLEENNFQRRKSSSEDDSLLNSEEKMNKPKIISGANGQPIYQCRYCDFESEERSALRLHVRSIHRRDKAYKCELCPYSASQKTNLSVHVMAVHERVKPFSCSYCPYTSSYKGALHSHMKTNHPDVDVNLEHQLCPLCEYPARDKDDLNNHLTNIHNVSHNMRKNRSLSSIQHIIKFLKTEIPTNSIFDTDYDYEEKPKRKRRRVAKKLPSDCKAELSSMNGENECIDTRLEYDNAIS